MAVARINPGWENEMSQPKFEVGELVIMQHATYFSETDGELATVIVPLGLRSCFDLNLMKKTWSHVYGVKVLNGTELRLWCRPWQLRKLDADKETFSGKQIRSRGNNRKTKLAVV